MTQTATKKPCGTTASYKRGCRCDDCKTAMSAWTKQYREANAEKIRARKLAYAERNREKESERAKRWYAENKERAKANVRKWQQENRERFLAHKRTGYAAKHGGKVAGVVIDYEALWTGRCGICEGEMDRDLPRGRKGSPTIDHIIPLSRGGLHVPENLQWAHMACNAGKRDN